MSGAIKKILEFQKSEITEHYVYNKLAKFSGGHNAQVIKKIAKDELSHYKFFRKYTGKDVKPDRFRIFIYTLMGRVFGLTFAIKLMEKGEGNAQKAYGSVKSKIPLIKKVIRDEEKHEKALIKLIKEEKIGYISSMVLGLNDALVELTGALAGFTFALQNTKIIGAAGVITGIAASFSMAAAEYLSQKAEKTNRHPLKAAMYTGIMYLAVVIMLVSPYFIVEAYYTAFITAVCLLLLIVIGFSFFVSVVQDKKFSSVFWEMIIIVTGIIILSFIIGLLARKFLDISI